MKKTIIAALVFIPATFLTTSCSVYTSSGYYPRSSYVYTPGYYPSYWTPNTYVGWGNTGYWRGYRGVSTVGWNTGWRGYRGYRGFGVRGWGHRW